MTIWIKCYEAYEDSHIMGVFTEEEMFKNKDSEVKRIAESEIEFLQNQIDRIKNERAPLQASFLQMCQNPVDKDDPSYKEYKKNRRLMAHRLERYNKPIQNLKNQIANFQNAIKGDSFWVDVVLNREHIHYRSYILNEEYCPVEEEINGII